MIVYKLPPIQLSKLKLFCTFLSRSFRFIIIIIIIVLKLYLYKAMMYCI